jgi:hypothetical protein
MGGSTVVVSTEAYETNKDGSIKRQERTHCQSAADGRWLRVDEFIGLSWTGLPIPRDRIASCRNPFELHPFRLVYLEMDGEVTKLGNVLCTDCKEHQKKRLFWRTVGGFGLIYNPEEF